MVHLQKQQTNEEKLKSLIEKVCSIEKNIINIKQKLTEQIEKFNHEDFNAKQKIAELAEIIEVDKEEVHLKSINQYGGGAWYFQHDCQEVIEDVKALDKKILLAEEELQKLNNDI